MTRLVRIVIQCVLVLLLVSTAVGIGASETGAAEKIVLVVIAGLLIYAATWVRRLGIRPQPRSRPPRQRRRIQAGPG